MVERRTLEYYGREDVQQALLRISAGREVVGVFGDGGFSSRPSTLLYANDILSHVNAGAVAFHGSLERWENPMSVGTKGYEKGRAGWDMILDFDCADTEHGKVAVKVFLDALRKHGVKNACVKFTGGTGFHMGVPFESFPAEVDYRPVKEQYPALARKVALYLKDYSRDALEKALLSKWTAEELSAQAHVPIEKVMGKDGINPFSIVDVDPVLISPRHLFRLPYSLHEKSFLVSLPLREGELADFKKEDASPSKVRFIRGFLDRHEEDEASLLVTEAVDWAAKRNVEAERVARRGPDLPRSAVPLAFAPPCIKAILEGLQDGKKRSLLILANYFSSLGWNWKDTEAEVLKWNQKNTPPLGESYVRGQLAWHERRRKPMPPPSCSKEGYYESFGVCHPDFLCGGEKKTVRNPVMYALRKSNRPEKTAKITRTRKAK
jgi:DNA primase catalytic subunit